MVESHKYKDYYPVELSNEYASASGDCQSMCCGNQIYFLWMRPYGQLDVELRFRLEDELIKLWKKHGTTGSYLSPIT